MNLFDLYLLLLPLFEPLSEFHSAGKVVGWEALNSTVNVTIFFIIFSFFLSFFFNSALHLFILDLFNTNWYSEVVGHSLTGFAS